MTRLINFTACLVHTCVKGETGWIVVTEEFIDRISQSPTVGVIFAPCERCTAAQQAPMQELRRISKAFYTAKESSSPTSRCHEVD